MAPPIEVTPELQARLDAKKAADAEERDLLARGAEWYKCLKPGCPARVLALTPPKRCPKCGAVSKNTDRALVPGETAALRRGVEIARGSHASQMTRAERRRVALAKRDVPPT